MTDLSTAYHEAAHAVAAFNLGLPTVYLTIRSKADGNGRTAFDTNTKASGSWTRSPARSSR
jgi:hypothetical protein